eukprot:TRINITY_DN1914_c2_g1_i12.p2 TRINITY_DN1914_c2_g1~~TRINITY_DN1914_c2_g1_i12.p2  ORF type:complete len:151 (+),score=48.12 TRINITY_DN1914_c2_g1_i12:264-716(+)
MWKHCVHARVLVCDDAELQLCGVLRFVMSLTSLGDAGTALRAAAAQAATMPSSTPSSPRTPLQPVHKCGSLSAAAPRMGVCVRQLAAVLLTLLRAMGTCWQRTASLVKAAVEASRASVAQAFTSELVNPPAETLGRLDSDDVVAELFSLL